MKKVYGDLEIMPLGELLGWLGDRAKSGFLRVAQEKGGKVKAFSLQQGLIDAFSSRRTAEELAEALRWPEGRFEFRPDLPAGAPASRRHLPCAESLQEAEQINRDAELRQLQLQEEAVRKISRQILKGEIELPPMPAVLSRLHMCLGGIGGSAGEAMKIVMADQILTSKILNVVNSAYYSLVSPVTSLQHAIVIMGFRSLLSVITTHGLGQAFSKNRAQVQEVLRHSFRCAFVAKQIAAAVGWDEEEAFVCGLLHDIGKTALLSLLDDSELDEPAQASLLEEFHAQAGVLLAAKWNLPELVIETIEWHHEPGQAASGRKAVEIVFLADGLVNDPGRLESLLADCSALELSREKVDAILEELLRAEGVLDRVA
ncbi:MAG: hypothetical protein C0617_09410 [Desulfuromonas sp.]|uniref:HDOD domain-containing protein n=1 Tax=Desulfuromonas sp. TaxID=892 RepID=UPI000CCA7078|nr:HDOD domain-containing protein [Desulfuromonas sp.]PLX84029.1 MAG: hypothetical protein C0617_09410 [Desulfuromonas sp.]